MSGTSSPPRRNLFQRLQKSFEKRRRLLLSWIGFDREWYIREYPEIGLTKINPFRHYVEFGVAQGKFKSGLHREITRWINQLKRGLPRAGSNEQDGMSSWPEPGKPARKRKAKFPRRNSVLVYNSFWKTFGGGEKHALEVALGLPGVEVIYLLGEEDFDLRKLLDRFGIRSRKKIVKLVREAVDTSATKRCHYFINSTYLSSLIPCCRNSFFIVNFPHPNPPAQFLSAYTFLCNSDFTASWVKAYWGDRENLRVLYPILGLKPQSLPRWDAKEKLLLSVGRFNAEGHNKNQLEIIRAFVRSGVSAYRLHLSGGVDPSLGPSERYFEECRQAALVSGNIALQANADRKKIELDFRRALFFVSATGLPNRPPEYQEHFGIAFFQGLLHGCIPIVYRGGQPELICAQHGIGHLFGTEEELVAIFEKVAATPWDFLLRESMRVRKIAAGMLAQMRKKNREVLRLL